ncbi:ABC multidrug transporter atrF [Penicillium atrosanguineum]|nr:ABC multidrug transporter atrF [Penicillium atrosanguineum]
MEGTTQPSSSRRGSIDIKFETDSAATVMGDETPYKNDSPDTSQHNDWSLLSRVQEQHERDLASGFKRQELGVTWQNLNVDVISSEAAVNENHIKESRNKPPLRTILNNSHGCVKPGEMLLVLGRPGSGCTTLLKMLSNRRGGYKSVEGDVRFGSLSSDEATKYRGQIVMNTEEELFFPTLTVGQTMDFATRLKVPFKLPDGVESAEAYRQETKKFLLESMNISHTEDTKVGNEYVRGVSGGERKRVSIVECLATRGSVFCWDNSTRGLDASTALEWTKAIRAMTDTLGLSTIFSFSTRASRSITVPAQARPFMEEAGFICREGSNVADFLTGITVPTERRIRDGYENRFLSQQGSSARDI